MVSYLDVLLGVLQVLEKSVFLPDDSTLLVGGGVRISISHTRLPTKETMKIRSLLVSTSRFNSVALRALGFEDLGPLLFTSSCHFNNSDGYLFVL